MKSVRRYLLTAVVVALVGAWVLPLQASSLLLSYSGDAYNNGGGPYGPASGAWWGVASYNYSNQLEGTVDYVVFAAGQFALAFPSSSYHPPANELVYAYQIMNTGPSDVSTFSVPIFQMRPADTIGYFSDIAGVVPTTSTLTISNTADGTATWFYSSSGSGTILTGQSSVGLAYASPNAPESDYGSVINSGLSSYILSLPSPSTTPAPEPSTIVLLALPAILLVLRRRYLCK